MSWSNEQMNRLALERDILQRSFPAVAWEWFDPKAPQRARVEGILHTNSSQKYRIRIAGLQGFPASCPDLFVISPMPLRDRAGKAMTGVSATMHTLEGSGGATKICHFQQSLWLPQNTLYQVVIKGRIWLEAYDAHLRTGEPLDRYLRHMTSSGPSAPSSASLPVSAEERTFLGFLRDLFR
jgi:hypothetical protein